MKAPIRGLLLLLAIACAIHSHAQDLPTTYRFISPNPAGGANDILTRIVAYTMQTELKATTVVENISGASGLIGQDKVAASKPDGSTLMVAGANQLLLDVVNRRDKMRQFAGLTGFAGIPLVLVGRPTLEPRTADELIAYLRKPDTRLNIAGGGTGTLPHMAAALLQQRAGVPLSYVPYRGAPNIVPDLIGGHVDLAVLVFPAALSSIKNGSVRAYGLFSATRVDAAPEVPLLRDSKALAGMEPLESWMAVYVPAATPPALRQKLGASLSDMLQKPDAVEAITKAGAIPRVIDAPSLVRLKDADAKLFGQIIESNKLQFDR